MDKNEGFAWKGKNEGFVGKEQTIVEDSLMLYDTQEFPLLSREIQSKRELRNAHLKPRTVKKDWSPAHDEKTCTKLLPQGRVFARCRNRLPFFTQLCADKKLPQPETVAQKPDLSSSGKGTMSANSSSTKAPTEPVPLSQSSPSNTKFPRANHGSPTPPSAPGTANLSTTTHGSSSSPSETVTHKPDLSSAPDDKLPHDDVAREDKLP